MISQKPFNPPMLDYSYHSRGSGCSRYSSHRSSLSINSKASKGHLNSFHSSHSSSQCSHYGGGKQHSRPVLQRLHPRCDLWLTLAITQLVFIGSLHASSPNNSYFSTAPQRSAVEVAALTLSSLSFVLSFVIGVGYFHSPFREYLITTASTPNYASSFKKLRESATMEQLLSLLLLTLVSIQSGLVLHPNGNYFAVTGSEIWNANLFYATWVGLYGAAYLWATTSIGNGRKDMHSIKLWFMVLFSSVCVSAMLLILQSGPMCQGMVLAETTHCQSSLTAGLLGVGSAIVSLICGVYLLYYTKRYRGWRSSRIRRIGLLCASLLLGIHSTIVGLVSSPSDPWNELGSVFLVSWMLWIFGVMLWKSYVESFFASPAPTIANINSLERRYKRRVMPKDIIRSGDGTHIIDGESEPKNIVLNIMEEGSSDSENDSVGRDSNVPHSETIHSLESLSKHPLDPDERVCKEYNSTNYYHRREENDSRYYHTDNTGYYEPTYSLDGSNYPTPYSSGPQAVRIRTELQEKVSTLDGIVDEFLQRQGSSRLLWTTLDNEAHRGFADGGTTHHRSRNNNNMQEPSMASSTLAPILRDQSSHLPEYSPTVNRNALKFMNSSMDVDTESEFDTAILQEKQREEDQARVAAMTRMHTNTAGRKPAGIMRRRPFRFRDYLMSNFSPIEEGSWEGSQITSSGIKTDLTNNSVSTRSVSMRSSVGPESISRKKNSKKKGHSGGKRSSLGSRHINRARRKPPPPPYPRPDRNKKDQTGIQQDDRGGSSLIVVTVDRIVPSSEKKPNEGSSSHPKKTGLTVKMDKYTTSKQMAREQSTPSTDSDSVSSSSSDFDIVVSDSHSVITELTQEGFDVENESSFLKQMLQEHEEFLSDVQGRCDNVGQEKLRAMTKKLEQHHIPEFYYEQH